VHRDKDAAALDSSFVPLSLVSWNTVDESSHETTGDTANACAGKRRHNGTRGNERTHAGNGNSAYFCEPAENTAGKCAGARARRCAFRSFGPFLVRKILVPSFSGNKTDGKLSR
jgi:hypothetical protein